MTQRTWLITGVNSGFGRLMTEALLEQGDRVAGTVRKLDAMNDLKTRYGDRLWLTNLDTTDLPAVRNVVEKAFAELGTIEVIVSNAGYGLFGAAEELSDEQVAQQLSTNLFGPIQLIRAALPHACPRRRAGNRPVHLRRAGGASGRFSLPCEQVGARRFPGFNRPGTCAVQDRRFDHRAGGARTNFRFGGAQLGTQLEAYKGTPAAMVHTMIKDTSRLPPGDPIRMAKVIIDSVDQNPAPKRIALGSDAYGAIHKALTDRLSALEAQREVAFSTDFPKDEQQAKQPA
jgi:NAD(P)-dependent dehydrogenase (short-subunit alcohol dehydrogenase family)